MNNFVLIVATIKIRGHSYSKDGMCEDHDSSVHVHSLEQWQVLDQAVQMKSVSLFKVIQKGNPSRCYRERTSDGLVYLMRCDRKPSCLHQVHVAIKGSELQDRGQATALQEVT